MTEKKRRKKKKKEKNQQEPVHAIKELYSFLERCFVQQVD